MATIAGLAGNSEALLVQGRPSGEIAVAPGNDAEIVQALGDRPCIAQVAGQREGLPGHQVGAIIVKPRAER
jgi:hypothetical protein